MSEGQPGKSTGPAGGWSQAEAERAFSLRADPRTNTVVKAAMRTGLVAALLLLLVGLVLQLAAGTDRAVGVKMFDLLAPRPIGERIMAIGVLLLALTPASGVLSLVFSWAREHDRLYVAVGCFVVAVLGAAVVVGLG
jgi:uncharacterized membrane protein